MDNLKWDEGFSVGNKVLDDQHYKIFSLINKLNNANLCLPPEEIESHVLKNMIEYAKEHLLFEEKLLKRIQYPDYEFHVSLHKDYLLRVADLSMKLMENCDKKTQQEFLDYLHHWWKHHILIEDMKYKKFIKKLKS